MNKLLCRPNEKGILKRINHFIKYRQKSLNTLSYIIYGQLQLSEQNRPYRGTNLEVNKKAAGALRGCETIEDVNEIFEMFNISDLREKIDHLVFAMGSPMVFMVPGDGKIESEYATILAAFLTGD
jgi:hypothetical protein